MFTQWQCGRFVLNLNQANIMGVLNCTPDSFSDGGQFITVDAALQRAEQMIAEGVDIIDVGAESTRPGSQAVSVAEEIKRLTPVVKALVADGRKPISIDTKKTAVMQAMLALGVDMINDVRGFEDAGAIEAVAGSDCGLCIMHMRGSPNTMQADTQYQNLIEEVNGYLLARANACEQAGIPIKRIMLDPGFGFGKTPGQNMALVKHSALFSNQRYPVLLGVSRKSSIGYYLNDAPVSERLNASITLAALAVWQGANVVRVHDIQATQQALAMVSALKQA